MPQVINTNIGSLNAQRNLNRSQNDLSTSLQRLSSGLRINSAKDDAAGLAIAERFTSQIRGTNQAVRNANDGIAVAQVAEGALQESSNILQRVRELAIQSANDSNSASDRANLQKEVNQLQQELERIATTTSFNGRNLLDGSFSGTQFHIGAFAYQTVQVDIGNVRNSAIGTQELTTFSGAGSINEAVTAGAAVSVNNVGAQTLTVDGVFGSEDISVTAGDSAARIAELVNRASEDTGVTASAVSYAKFSAFSEAGGDTISFDLTGSGTAAISATLDNNTDLSALADAINAESGTTGISATLNTAGDEVTLFSSSGEDILVQDFTAANNTAATISFGGVQSDSVTAVGTAATLTGNGTDDSVVGGSVIFNSSRAFTVESDVAADLIETADTPESSTLQSVEDVDISTQLGANDAISVIEGALARVAETRAGLGAVQNRLSSTISNLQNLSENVSAARSQIQDADFAAETAELTRAQILQQAGISVLSQANALPQQVLALLQ